MDVLQRFGANICAQRRANKSKTAAPVILWRIINVIISTMLTDKVSADPSYIGMFSYKSEPHTLGLKVSPSSCRHRHALQNRFHLPEVPLKELFLPQTVVLSPS